AAIYGKMTPQELLWAVTLDAARVLKMDSEVGSLEIGKRADIALWGLPGISSLPYFFGNVVADEVFIGGDLVFENPVSVRRY
ncbi:amidohydrolase family protein, partial [bacterium]|nr:amidohydrolase family protein [bacterium]